ncbi:MAG: hypothetical protein ACREH5_02825 [Candidatus Omnitrophota bacterium]
MSAQGVVYVATGAAYFEEACRSAESLKQRSPRLPITLFSDQKAKKGLFDDVVPVSDAHFGCRDKIAYMRMSPYERTLYLDTDTYVCGDLSDLFSLLEHFDAAAAHAPNRRGYSGQGAPESFPEFQGGVLLFKRSAAVLDLLDRWLKAYEAHSAIGAAGVPQRGYEHKQLKVYDQPLLRELLYRSTLRVATLPPEYNCRVGSRGYVCDEVKVLHGRHYPDLAGLARKINATRGRRLFMISGKSVRVVPSDREVVFMVTRERNGIK